MTRRIPKLPPPEGPDSSSQRPLRRRPWLPYARLGLAHRRNSQSSRRAFGDAQTARRVCSYRRGPTWRCSCCSHYRSDSRSPLRRCWGEIKPASSGTQVARSAHGAETIATEPRNRVLPPLLRPSRQAQGCWCRARNRCAPGRIRTRGVQPKEPVRPGAPRESTVAFGAAQRLLAAAYPAIRLAQTEQSPMNSPPAEQRSPLTSNRASRRRRSSCSFLIPILLLVCLFSFFMRLGGEGARRGDCGLLGVQRAKGRKKRQRRIRPKRSPSPPRCAGSRCRRWPSSAETPADYLDDPLEVPGRR